VLGATGDRRTAFSCLTQPTSRSRSASRRWDVRTCGTLRDSNTHLPRGRRRSGPRRRPRLRSRLASRFASATHSFPISSRPASSSATRTAASSSRFRLRAFAQAPASSSRSSHGSVTKAHVGSQWSLSTRRPTSVEACSFGGTSARTTRRPVEHVTGAELA